MQHPGPLTLVLLAVGVMACQAVDPAQPQDSADVSMTVDAGVHDAQLGRPDFFVGVDADRPPQPDAEIDGDPPPDVGPPPDADLPDMAPDMGPPPAVNLECPRPWVGLDDSAPRACNGRRVFTMDPGFDVDTVAIARSEQGRLAFGWSVADFADGGNYLIRVVEEDDLELVVEHTIMPDSAFGELSGYRSKIQPLRETFHLVHWSQSDFGSSVFYRQVRPDGQLSERETVDAQVGRRGALDMVVDQRGGVHVAWHDKASGEFRVRSRPPEGGAWSDQVVLDTDLTLDQNNDGATSLSIEPDGALHIAYQLALSRFGTAPRSRTRLGGEWTTRRTLDNFANARTSGVGLDLISFEGVRSVVYLDWLAGNGEIRLASYSSSNDPPAVEILEPGLPMEMPPPRYPLAMAVDDQGLLHLTMLDQGAQSSRLLYRRQVEVGGRTVWLTDIIDDDVEPTGLAVDMVVEPATRTPHILFYDPNNGFHAYAVARTPDP